MKTCKFCKLEKDLEDYYVQSTSKDGRRNDCKVCVKLRKAEREADPKVKAARAEKEKLRRSLNKDQINATLREQRSGTKEKRLATNRKQQEWRAGKGKSSYQHSLLKRRNTYQETKQINYKTYEYIRLRDRRARYIRNRPDLSHSTIKEYSMFLEDCKICRYCGKDCANEWTLDHIIPQIKNGDNTVDNLVISCKQCNSSKKDQTLIVWLAVQNELRNNN